MEPELTGVIVFLAMLLLAWWQKDMILWWLSGYITISTAGAWISELPAICIMLYLLAVYEFYLGLMIALKAGGDARGLSQFRSIWQRIKR